MTSYKKLKQIFNDAALSSDIAGILHWDMSTMMPKNSRENRDVNNNGFSPNAYKPS